MSEIKDFISQAAGYIPGLFLYAPDCMVINRNKMASEMDRKQTVESDKYSDFSIRAFLLLFTRFSYLALGLWLGLRR